MMATLTFDLLTKSEEKWQNTLGEQFKWKTVYQIPYKCSTDTTLRSFQYKILTRIIPTNKLLYKYKIKPSNTCEFCSSYVETIEHIFWECATVQPIWNELKTLFIAVGIDINLTLKDVCVGTFQGGIDNEVINYIIILMKKIHF